MSDPSTPSGAQSAAAHPAPTAAASESASTTDDNGAEGTPEPETFANRAERRAQGKGRSQPPPASKGKQIGGRSAVTNPRQYGTRRSGG